jgi:hypothetical protein
MFSDTSSPTGSSIRNNGDSAYDRLANETCMNRGVERIAVGFESKVDEIVATDKQLNQRHCADLVQKRRCPSKREEVAATSKRKRTKQVSKAKGDDQVLKPPKKCAPMPMCDSEHTKRPSKAGFVQQGPRPEERTNEDKPAVGNMTTGTNNVFASLETVTNNQEEIGDSDILKGKQKYDSCVDIEHGGAAKITDFPPSSKKCEIFGTSHTTLDDSFGDESFILQVQQTTGPVLSLEDLPSGHPRRAWNKIATEAHPQSKANIRNKAGIQFGNHTKHRMRAFLKELFRFKTLKAFQIFLTIYIAVVTFADIGPHGGMRDPHTGFIVDPHSAERTENGIFLAHGDERPIIATSTFQLACVGFARLSAWFMYPSKYRYHFSPIYPVYLHNEHSSTLLPFYQPMSS